MAVPKKKRSKRLSKSKRTVFLIKKKKIELFKKINLISRFFFIKKKLFK